MSKEGTLKKNSGLVDVGTVMTVLVPLLYTAGWSFAYHYFDRFHLGLIGLDISKEHLFLYSFWVIRDQVLLSVIALLLVVIIYVLVKYGFKRVKIGTSNKKAENQIDLYDGRRIWLIVKLILMPTMTLAVFSLFYYMGSRMAVSLYEQQVLADFPSYPRVKVWLTEQAQKEAGAVADVWRKGCFRLLLRDENYLYIFESAKAGDKIPTEIIPTRLVRSVRVLPQYHSCDE